MDDRFKTGQRHVTNGELSVFFGALLCAWIAIAWLDLGYYQRLLASAVAEIVVFETATAGQIHMSTGIEERMGGQKWRFAVWFFYVLIGIVLFSLAVIVMCFR